MLKDMKRSPETHEFRYIKPKPEPDLLYEMVKNYFNLEANIFDKFTEKTGKRREYTKAINALIARRLPKICKILSIGCGTGSRELEIQKLSGQNYEICGVEISSEMAEIAIRNGISCETSNWLEVTPKEKFDAVLFLFAFGHLATSADRKKALQNVRKSLKKGAPFFMDVLNIDDKNEWGPKIKTEFQKSDLIKAGYELGDVLYSKIGDKKISYWHYFSKDEIDSLLKSVDFHEIQYAYINYGSDSGKLVGPGEGSIFVEAR